MIISRNIPSTVQAPVHVRTGVVEVWYGEPVSLGLVEQVGHSWWTVDGRRHASARAAMRYLVAARKAGRVLREKPDRPRAPAETPVQQVVAEVPETGATGATVTGATKEQLRDVLIDLDLSDPVVLGILRMLRDRARGAGTGTRDTEQ